MLSNPCAPHFMVTLTSGVVNPDHIWKSISYQHFNTIQITKNS